MAREILLNFGVKKLSEAKKLVAAVYKEAKAVAKTIEDAGERKKALAEAKSENIANRQALREEAAAQKQDLRGAKIRKRSRGGLFGPISGLPEFGDASESALQFAQGNGAVTGIGLTVRAIAGAASTLGPIGAFAGVVAGIAWTEIINPFLQRELEALKRERLDPLQARLEQLESLEFARQLRENVRVQERLGGEFAAQDRVLQEALATKRVVGTSRIQRLSEFGG